MFIDWFTVSAQVLNFLILVWLLKRFLYKPILNAIDARESRIATELAEAASKMEEAQKERDDFKYKNKAFNRQRDDLLSKVRDEANAERQRLFDEARQAAHALHTKRQEALDREQQNLNNAISRRTQEEVFSIAQKALTTLAGVSLEARICEVFTAHLRELGGERRDDLVKALHAATGPVLVRSAFDLPDEQRGAIQQALNGLLAAAPSSPLKAAPSTSLRAGIHLRFETVPEVISGIEIFASGQKVAWSIADYLGSLEKGVRELLQEQFKPQAKPGMRATNVPKTSAQEAVHS